jgi:hypothetical protein
MADSHHADDHQGAAPHDIWLHMTPQMRADLRHEDADAWKHVVGVLLFIVSVGLLLAVLTVIVSA